MMPAEITDTLMRLDTRRHIVPARLELSQRDEFPGWTAQIMADPLRRPIFGHGQTASGAIEACARACGTIDWRRVAR